MTKLTSGIETFTEPFPHAVVEGCMPAGLVREAAAAWPGPDWDGWSVHYHSQLEEKLACDDWKRIPVPCRSLLNLMLNMNLYALWGDLTSTGAGLIADASLWGGGMHAIARGGHLDVHEDSDVHPLLGWHRRVNAVLFLNPRWEESWNGQLELWSRDMSRCCKKINPFPGRMVVFLTDDKHFHGVPETVQCPEGVQRMTLATFWFSLPRPGRQFKRQRANFVDRPGDRHDPDKSALQARRRRADP